MKLNRISRYFYNNKKYKKVIFKIKFSKITWTDENGMKYRDSFLYILHNDFINEESSSSHSFYFSKLIKLDVDSKIGITGDYLFNLNSTDMKYILNLLHNGELHYDSEGKYFLQ